MTSIAALLFAVAVLEELSSGIPAAGAPDIERSLGLTHTATATVLYVVPGLVALVIDPLVYFAAERVGRPVMVRLGLAAMAAAFFAAAIAPGAVTLACAISVWHVACGAAIAFSEVTLVDLWPEQRARTMARWTLFASVGDLGGPVLLGALAMLGISGERWRIGFLVIGALVAMLAIAVALRRFPTPPAAPDENEPTLWQATREAIRDRVLICWLFGCALCNLLDEILIVFASIHLRDDLGATAVGQSVVISAFIVGTTLGLVVLDRLLTRHREQRLIIAIGSACAAVFALWLAAPTVWLSALLMLAVGLTAGPLYPLAIAQAYARCPGRSSVVLVVSHLFSPIALAIPWLLGRVADHAGALAALALLAAQPIGLVVLALVTTGDRDSRDSRTGDAP